MFVTRWVVWCPIVLFVLRRFYMFVIIFVMRYRACRPTWACRGTCGIPLLCWRRRRFRVIICRKIRILLLRCRSLRRLSMAMLSRVPWVGCCRIRVCRRVWLPIERLFISLIVSGRLYSRVRWSILVILGCRTLWLRGRCTRR